MHDRLEQLDLYATFGVRVDDLREPFVTFFTSGLGYLEHYAKTVFCEGVSAITDYLLQIRNLSPLQRLALEG